MCKPISSNSLTASNDAVAEPTRQTALATLQQRTEALFEGFQRVGRARQTLQLSQLDIPKARADLAGKVAQLDQLSAACARARGDSRLAHSLFAPPSPGQRVTHIEQIGISESAVLATDEKLEDAVEMAQHARDQVQVHQELLSKLNRKVDVLERLLVAVRQDTEKLRKTSCRLRPSLLQRAALPAL